MFADIFNPPMLKLRNEMDFETGSNKALPGEYKTGCHGVKITRMRVDRR